MARILVTGGAGYVGSHACKALAKHGHDVIVFDDLSRGHADFVKWGPLEAGSLLDKPRLQEVFDRHKVDAVMHFAAFAYVGESVERPELYYRNNVLGTLTLLETMIEHDVKKMVFSSTCAVYGVPTVIPISEDALLNPINPYGRTKLTVENMLEDFGSGYGLESVSLRYFNAAGADYDSDIGERHVPETHAIPLAILAALGEGSTFNLFGDDYRTPDGTAIRDYVHVNDLALAHISALDHLLSGGKSLKLNVGTGKGTSVRELIDAVERVTGRNVPIEVGPRRQGDSPILVADSTRLRTQLSWVPQFTVIDQIVVTAVRWHKKELQ